MCLAIMQRISKRKERRSIRIWTKGKRKMKTLNVMESEGKIKGIGKLVVKEEKSFPSKLW